MRFVWVVKLELVETTGLYDVETTGLYDVETTGLYDGESVEIGLLYVAI